MNRKLNIESLEAFILDHLSTKPQIKRWVVAYSGGLDSSVLLHVMAAANQSLVEPKPILAVHINHGLSVNASQWQQHCEQRATALGVTFVAQQVVVENQGQGVEAAAREQRYNAFAHIMQNDDCLVTGHHEDDQSETFLLRLLRGAGVQGLGAMAMMRGFEQGQLLRPLLKIPRQYLERYAHNNNLTWVDDESNKDTIFDRNFLRQKVIPLLSSRWSQVTSRLADTAERMQSAQQLLHDLAVIDLQDLSLQQERYGISLDLLALKKLNKERINNMLRYWCLQQCLAQPNAQQLQEVHRQLLSQDNMLTQAVVAWGVGSQACELRQFQQRLYLMTVLPEFRPLAEKIHWPLKKASTLDLRQYGAGELSLELSAGAVGLSKTCLDNANDITIRWREGGERCTPEGKKNSQQLKKLLQEYQLETWLRNRVPLIYIDDHLAAVGDLWVCDAFAAKDASTGLSLQWSFPSINHLAH